MRKMLIWALTLALAMPAALSAQETAKEATRSTRQSFTVSQTIPPQQSVVALDDVGKAGVSEKKFRLGKQLDTQCDEAYALAPRANAEGTATIDDYLGAKNVMAHVYSTKNIRATATTVTKIDDTHVQFNGFIYSDVNVTAEINLTTGEATIPGGQFLTEADNIGKISLCRIDLTKGVYSTTDPIRAKLYNGAYHIEDAYGFFVTEGPEVGKYLNVGLLEYTAIAKPNGQATSKVITYGGDGTMTAANQQVSDIKSNVYAYPVGTDRLRLMMLPIHTSGTLTDIMVNLESNKTMTIDPQTVYNISIIGDFNYYGMTESTDATGKIKYSASILSPINATYADNTFTWNGWLVGTSSGTIYSSGKSVSVTLDSPVTFPDATSTELQGDGSETNPYVIATANDLVTLAYRTLNDTGARGTLKTSPYDAEDKYYDVFEGKYFSVTNDIDLSALTVAYKPVGNKQFRFAGILEGNSHTISNLDIKSYAYDYCSLFGSLGTPGTIRNLTVADPHINSLGYGVAGAVAYNAGTIDNVKVTSPRLTASKGYNMGGLAAFNYGTISNCRVDNLYASSLGFMGGVAGRLVSGTISDSHATGNIYVNGTQAYGGGIAGYVTKLTTTTPGSLMTDCSFAGNIVSVNNQVGLGGLAGAFNFSTAERCLANANVNNLPGSSTIAGSLVGGLVGTAGESNLTDCYVSGQVRNAEAANTGGLVGHSSEYTNPVGTVFTNCYSSAMLTTKSTNEHKGLAGDMTNITFNNCYYDAQIAAAADETYGKTTAEMTTAEGLTGFSADVWMFEQGLYPRLKKQADSDVARVSASALALDTKDVLTSVANNFTYKGAEGVEWKAVIDGKFDTAKGHAFSFENGVGKLNYDQHTDTIFVAKGDITKYYVANIAPVLFSGSGTADDPWVISTTDDFKKFAETTVNATMPFTDRHFILANDLDFGGETITAVCRDNAGKLAFGGTFDGKGHVIDNFVITQVGFADDGKFDARSALNCNYAAPFGNLDNTGVIRNLTVGPKAVINGALTAGGIVGKSIGLVENCRNYATVTAYNSNAGGIVGYIIKNTDKTKPGKGRIKGCYNNGLVRANYNSAGGIVAYANDAEVENCENTGAVSAYCFNDARKPGDQYNAGGICGNVTASTFTNVVNSGEVSSYKNVGGLFGIISGTTASVVTNAINYGIVTSWTDRMTSGQITGSNAIATYTNCYADRQLQNTDMVANGSYKGVTAAATAEMTGGKITLPEEAWAQAEGTYPTMKYTDIPAQVELNSKAVALFADKETAANMLTTATLSKAVTWSLTDAREAFTIADNKLTATPAKELTNAKLVATDGTNTRSIPLSTIDIFILSGQGTAELPFLINTADDYLKLANFVNTSKFDYTGYMFKVTADLDFTSKTFEPVGNNGAMFNGELDGGNMKFQNIAYTVTGKTDTYKGLFGIVGSQGVIRNVILADNSSISAYSHTGGIAGALFGKVIDSKNYAKVSTTGTTNCGGIAGIAMPGASVESCGNYGTVTAKTTIAGGIVGGTPANAFITIDKCANEGTVSGTSKIGGIAGSASADVTHCDNNGTVTATTNYAGGLVGEALLPSAISDGTNSGSIATPQYMGGIVASNAAHTAAQPFVVERCINKANIAVGTKGYCGGIAGTLKNGTRLRDCHNTGDILTGETTTAMRVGGISGDISSGKNVISSIENCSNTGAIRANTIVGGIIGYSDNAQDDGAYIRNSFNKGTVTGLSTVAATSVGGLLGNGDSFIIEDCHNNGDVTSNGGYVGGLVGQKNSFITSFSRNYNTGKVTGKNAGTGGLIGYGRADMKDCANYGEVSGTTYVAGLIGKTGPVASTLYTIKADNSYNAAPVVASATGGVTSNAICIAADTRYYELGVIIYDKDVNAAGTADAALGNAIKGLTTAELCAEDMGEAFINTAATYPLLAASATNADLLIECAKVILADGDGFDNVTQAFAIGTPEGVAWTASDNLTITGNTVTPANKEKGEKATLTLTAGELTRTFELTLNAEASGISGISDNGKTVAVRQLFNTAGERVVTPERGTVVIERTVYTDGTVSVRKLKN